MATSPPPHAPGLSLPKKRPSITLPPNPNPSKRRKGSIASASAHPLRQTSFPPPDQQQAALYSPVSGDDELDVDDEIASAVGSTTSGNRQTNQKKRGGGANSTRGRSSNTGNAGKVGRPPKRSDTASVADGETSTITSGRRGGAPSTTGPNNASGGGAEDEEEGSDDDDANVEDTALEGGKLTRARQEEEKSRRAMFLSALPPAHFQRYEQWNRIHLKKEVVRRLTNQTLSQSVPASVITTINAYTKVFAGEIVDRARGVQREWVGAMEMLPTGEKNEMRGEGEGGAEVKERDLGPLLPEHLREALRRYKMDRDGGTVGFTGMSLEGREAAAVRSGGRRLFK